MRAPKRVVRRALSSAEKKAPKRVVKKVQRWVVKMAPKRAESVLLLYLLLNRRPHRA